MKLEIPRLKKLEEAVLLEREYERKLYHDSLMNNSLQHLVSEGTAWYPLHIEDKGFTIGEYPTLTLSISEDKLVSHQFKSGSIVRFFQNDNGNLTKNSLSASIQYISRNTCKIILDENDLPDWYDEGRIGIIADYDEKSTKEMLTALERLKSEKDSPVANIRDIIYLQNKPVASVKTFQPENKNLNASQIKAIEFILGSEDITIVHGPPGTGKTTTIVEAVVQLTRIGQQVLVSAASNSAVDLLVEKCHDSGLRVLRIGHISRISEDIVSHTLEYQMENSVEFQEIKKLRKQADEYRKLALKYKRQFGPEEREQRQLLLKEAKEINKHILWIEDFLIERLIDQAQVICATLVGTANKFLRNRTFKTCIIDEVSQALEPATWLPILKSERVVLAGDPFQLPPTIKCRDAEKLGLHMSLMESAFHLDSRVFLLDTQYRMKEEIMGYSNIVFYQNKLKAAESTHKHVFQIKEFQFQPIEFIDTAGCGFNELRNESTESLYNDDETKLLFNHLGKTLEHISYGYDQLTIGVIAPYREQVIRMRRYDEEYSHLADHFDMDINTIDSFQGQERDIIYISMVRSNDEGQIGFLKDYRRMNVAFTRAKRMVRIIGDSATLTQDKFYAEWLDYIHSIGAYKSAWEYQS